MTLVLHGLLHTEAECVMTLVSGCLLAGPFVAMGLYDLSRRREQAQAANFMVSLTCWKPHLRSLGLLVGALVVLELMWGRVSLVMLALFFDTGLPTSAGLMEAAVNANNLDFVATFVVASGFFAMLVFTLSVVGFMRRAPTLLGQGSTCSSGGWPQLPAPSGEREPAYAAITPVSQTADACSAEILL